MSALGRLTARAQPFVAAALTSRTRRDARRWAHERMRRVRGAPHRLTAFVRPDDPYALVLLHGLQHVRERFEVEIDARIVGPTPAALDPAPERLHAWARQDAGRVARLYDHAVPEFDERRCTRADAAALATVQGLTEVRAALETWWRDGTVPSRRSDDRLDANDRERHRRGHYASAMVHYAGEWYWGVDRLNHLERRLQSLGLAREGTTPGFERRFAFLTSPAPAAAPSDTLELFWSGRSPYSYLALERAYQLADHFRVPLRIRPVLPMVMRNLSVPTRKRFYILDDAKREADWLHIPLGFVRDPVGPGIERGYALLDVARQRDRLREYVHTFSTGVWSRGLDAATDQGLRTIAEDAGIPWSACEAALRSDHWRAEVEDNREALDTAGHWGVPVLRVADTTVWGQDRFWVLEDALSRVSAG